jgi:hypothetical protein
MKQNRHVKIATGTYYESAGEFGKVNSCECPPGREKWLITWWGQMGTSFARLVSPCARPGAAVAGCHLLCFGSGSAWAENGEFVCVLLAVASCRFSFWVSLHVSWFWSCMGTAR